MLVKIIRVGLRFPAVCLPLPCQMAQGKRSQVIDEGREIRAVTGPQGIDGAN
jgi:hypothetical protein